MIRVGVAGWDYPDWEGIVYPSPAPRGFDRLAHLAACFDLVEINVTFYRQPDPAAVRSWAARVAPFPSFRFTAKLYRAFTHPAWRSGRRPGMTVDLATEAERFRAGVRPLLDAGRLGAVLAQFPHSFHDTGAAREHLERVRSLLEGLPLVAEFRHRDWGHEEALRFLNDRRIGFCNIDQPSIGAGIRPTGHVTAPWAYIRLHGRNAENWFQTGATAAARYDYLYSMNELRPWIERAERLQDRAEEVFIVANNHFRGKAPANALMIKGAIARKRVAAPEGLVDAYPALQEWTVRTKFGSPEQGQLFD